MLKIFDSNSETASAEAAFDELLKNDAPGSKHVVITPDRFTLSVEKKLFEYVGLPGAINIEVFSFTNFAKRAVKNLPKCLSKEGTVLLLREVLEKEKENLEYYRNVSHLKTFPRELFAVMASIRNSGVSPEKLFETFASGGDALSAKYRDVARVYRRYQEELNRRFTDTTGRLDALIERAVTLPEVTESHFYLVGFFRFYQKQLEIIEALVKCAKSVNIAATTSSGGANAALFGSKSKEDFERIRRNTGTEYEYARKEAALPFPLDAMSKTVFSYRTGKLSPSDRVVLFRENTPYDELKAVAREIRRLVRHENYRYREIAVAAYDDDYKTVAKEIFPRFGIPFFSDEKYPLKTAPSIRYFTAAMDVLAENFKKCAVFAFVKHPLFPADRSETDAFENYVLKYGVDYGGFSVPFEKGAPEELARAEAVRQTLISSCPHFPEPLDFAAAADCARAFFSEELLKREAGLTDDPAYRKLSARAPELFCSELDEAVEIFGKKPVGLREFREIAAAAILSIEVSLIPIKNDCVFFGTGEESALYGIKALFLVGAADGVVPAVGGYQAIMPEKDVLLFEKRGIPLYPTPVDRLREEKAKLVNLIAKAGERFYASYASYDLRSEPAAESEFLKELRQVTGYPLASLGARFSAERVIDEESAADFLVTEENALYEYRLWKGGGANGNPAFFRSLGQVLEKRGETEAFREEIAETLSNNKAKFFFRTEDGAPVSSASQLERYASCPYRHFLDYGLKIRERDVAEAAGADVGTIVHRALELYFKNTLGKLKTLSDAAIAREAEKAVGEAFRMERAEILRGTKNGKILFRALQNELYSWIPKLTDAVKNSEFEPRLIEYRFDCASQNAVALDTAFGTLSLTGKIDRVDASGDDLFLVDYKTGAAEADLSELYEGRKLQLALYALPFRKTGKRVVGAFYLPLPDGYRAVGRSLSLTGYVASPPGAERRFDRTYRDDGAWESGFFPLKTKSSGGKIGTVAKPGSYLLTEREFSALLNFGEGAAVNAAEEAERGFIAKRPVVGACRFCPYTPLCAEKRERKSRNVKLADGTFFRAADGEEDE